MTNNAPEENLTLEKTEQPPELIRVVGAPRFEPTGAPEKITGVQAADA